MESSNLNLVKLALRTGGHLVLLVNPCFSLQLLLQFLNLFLVLFKLHLRLSSQRFIFVLDFLELLRVFLFLLIVFRGQLFFLHHLLFQVFLQIVNFLQKQNLLFVEFWLQNYVFSLCVFRSFLGYQDFVFQFLELLAGFIFFFVKLVFQLLFKFFLV